MTAAGWGVIATIAIFLFLQTGVIAFFLGGLAARVNGLEGRPVDTDCKAELAAMGATLKSLEGTLERVERHFADRLDSFGRELEIVRNNAAQAKEWAGAGRRRSAEG